MAGGPDAEIVIELSADAAKAAAEIEAAVSKALAAAMRTKAGRDALNHVINDFLKGFAKVGQASQRVWASNTASGTASAKAVGNAFENMFKRVSTKSNQAFRLNQARGAAPELQALNALVADLSGNFKTLATDARSFNTVLTQMAVSARAQLAAVTQEQRTAQQLTTSTNAILNTEAQERANKLTNATKLQLANIRAESAASRNASNERIAHVRRFTQIATTSIRSLTQVFRTVFNGATVILRNAVNGMQSVIRGLANAFRATFQAINGIVRSFASGFGKAFSGIGRGVTSALRGVSSAIRAALSRDEAATRASMNRRERMAQHSAGQQRNFLTTAFQASGLAGGAAGIFGILRAGFERFSDVETLQFRFERFLGSAEKAKSLIQDLSDFARTTAFDLPGVANLATNFLAMGQSAGEATANVRKLADITAFAGGNTESLERIQRALGQIISTGKLQGDELNQLAENLPGINIRQIIADQMGVSTAELVKMQESGDISADAFIGAFLTGIDDPRFQGAAVAIAGTLEGRLANLKESFGIFGAEIIGLAYGPISAAMTKITGFLTLAGDFISGDMFKAEAPTAADNPYVQMADDAMIAFEDLPKEWQRQLEEGFGWEEGKGFVVSAQDAEEWWNAMHPPADIEDTVSVLEQLRDVLFDFAKGVGAGAAIAGGFKAIALALRFLVSPLSAAILLFGSLGVFWGRITDASPKLRSSLHILGQQFGNLRGALGDTLKLVGNLISNAFFGKPGFFKNVGDRVANFVNKIGLGVNQFRQWVTWANRMTEAGRFGEVIDSASEHLKDFLGNLLGLSDAQSDFAQSLGGNDFGNLLAAGLDKLETVPILGPIVGFARRVINTLIDAFRGAVDFVGGIWDAVFGGGGAGGREQDSLENQVLGEDSKGTKVLDRLEDTFLGPVVRFFRGPFIDAIHGIGGFLSGIFDRFLLPGFKAVGNFFANDFIPGIVNVASTIGRFFQPAILTVGNLLGQVGTLLAPLGGAISGFVSTWQDEGIGAALSGLWDGIAESAGNLWEGENGTGGLKAGLQGALDSVRTWFSENFTYANLSKAALTALGAIRTVGRTIGKFLSSPEFIGTVTIAVGAFAGIVASILGAFLLGLGEGIAREVPRWAKLISSGLTAGWNALTAGAFDFLPDPIVDAVNAMLSSPILSTGIALGLGLLAGKIVTGLVGAIRTAATPKAISAGGPGGGANFATLGLNIASGLFNSVVSGFRGVGKGALSLAQMIIPRFPADTANTAATTGGGIGARVMGGMNSFFRRTVVSPLAGLKTRLDSIKEKAVANFGSVGTAIASAVVGGIAAFEFGRYAGKKGDAGTIIMALLGGAATGGAIGATFGGVGAAIGAALGLAITGVGIAIGTSGRKAEEAAAQVQAYADALQAAGAGADVATVGAQTFIDQLTAPGSDTKIRDVFVTAGTNISEFLREGISDPDSKADLDNALADLMQDFGANIEDSDLSDTAKNFVFDLRGAIRDAAATGEQFRFDDFLEQYDTSHGDVLGTQALKELKDAGFDVAGALQYATVQANSLEGSLQLEGANVALKGVVDGVTNMIDPIDTVEEGLSLIQDSLAQGDTARQIANLLGNSDMTTTESLEALEQAADDVATKVDDARQAFLDALNATVIPDAQGDVPTTFETATDQFIADLPGIRDRMTSILEGGDPVVIESEMRIEEGTAKSDITGILADAVDAGLIVDDASMDAFLEQLRTKVNDADLSPEATTMLNTLIDGFEEGDYSTLLTQFTSALTDQQKLAETGRIMAAGIKAAFGENTAGLGNIIGGPTGLPTTPTAPGQVGVTLAPLTTDDLAAVFDNVDTDKVGKDIGTEVGNKIPAGIRESDAESGLKTELNSLGTGLHGTATSSGVLVGIKFVKAIGSGVTSAAQVPQTNMRNVVGGVKLAAARGNQGMQEAGSNMVRSLAQGIRNSAIIAILAAAAVAQAVIQTVRRILQIGSPSKVFVTIGRQIGEGFMEGIKDSEGDMAAAISEAISNAVAKGVQQAGLAVARAQVAGTIWDLIQPAVLPGGTTTAELVNAQLSLKVDLAGFVADLRDGLSEALGSLGHEDLASANIGAAGIRLDLRSAFNDATEQFNDAIAHSKEIDDYAAALKKLKDELASGALATAARTRLQREAKATLNEEKAQLDEHLRRLRESYLKGKIKKADYDEQVKQLNDAYKTGPLEAYYDELAKIERNFKNGTLAAEEYADQLAKLGEKPEPLSFTEKDILASGIKTLDVNTTAGRANREAIDDALSKIKAWGQAALAAGTPMADVVKNMKIYIKQITDAAAAAGLNATTVQSIVAAFGLSTADLDKLLKEAVSLDVRTVAGMENVKTFNEKLQGIRDYASMLLKAGVSTEEVTKQIKAMRDQLIKDAKAFGFNATQIQALVEQMGLSDSALAALVQQLKDFDAATRGATAAAEAAANAANQAGGGGVVRPIGEVHVHVPYGDPEAVARATANTLAYAGPTNW